MSARADRGAGGGRTPATIAAELAEVERHLREAPPHASGAGARLQARRAALERELTAARGAAQHDDDRR